MLREQTEWNGYTWMDMTSGKEFESFVSNCELCGHDNFNCEFSTSHSIHTNPKDAPLVVIWCLLGDDYKIFRNFQFFQNFFRVT